MASSQTEKMEGPAAAMQTDWVAVHMPLPALPHGGTWPVGGARVLIDRRR